MLGPTSVLGIYLSKGEFDMAISVFNKAIELNPRKAKAYFGRGIAYLGKFQYDKAISDFSQAIEINPTFAEAYEGRAGAYIGQGKLDEAASDLNKAEEIDPTIAEAYKNRGLGYRSKSSEEFIFPAVLMDGRRGGDLVLGSTTMKQAVKMLPPWPGHGPKRVQRGDIKTSSGKVGEVLRKVKYQYNAMAADFILGFDKNKKLVIIQTSLSTDRSAQEKMSNMMNQNQLEEESRDSNGIRMRGEIMPCVTMEVLVPSAGDKPIEAVGYFFTCPTK
jgi:tetratricopeptide (TPR) repeat protein